MGDSSAGYPPSFSLRDLEEEENLQAVGLGFIFLGVVVIGGCFGPQVVEALGYTVAHHWVNSNFDAMTAVIICALPLIVLGVGVWKRSATACTIALGLYALCCLCGVMVTVVAGVALIRGHLAESLHDFGSILVFVVSALGYMALSRSTIVCTDAYSLVLADTPNERPVVTRSRILWMMLAVIVWAVIYPHVK